LAGGNVPSVLPLNLGEKQKQPQWEALACKTLAGQFRRRFARREKEEKKPPPKKTRKKEESARDGLAKGQEPGYLQGSKGGGGSSMSSRGRKNGWRVGKTAGVDTGPNPRLKGTKGGKAKKKSRPKPNQGKGAIKKRERSVLGHEGDKDGIGERKKGKARGPKAYGKKRPKFGVLKGPRVAKCGGGEGGKGASCQKGGGLKKTSQGWREEVQAGEKKGTRKGKAETDKKKKEWRGGNWEERGVKKNGA